MKKILDKAIMQSVAACMPLAAGYVAIWPAIIALRFFRMVLLSRIRKPETKLKLGLEELPTAHGGGVQPCKLQGLGLRDCYIAIGYIPLKSDQALAVDHELAHEMLCEKCDRRMKLIEPMVHSLNRSYRVIVRCIHCRHAVEV